MRAGHSFEEHVAQLGPQVTPEIAGAAMVELVQADATSLAPAYLLTGAGLQDLPRPAPDLSNSPIQGRP